jgi:crotonobetainyl-CoA:carnitine CoA-transferase CaiB-like acyl-CoA transferase
MPAAPHGVYRCKPRGDDDDRWIAIAVRTQAEWNRFAAAIGAPAWTTAKQFRTLYLRMRNRDELDQHIARWTADYEAESVMTILQAAKVPAGVVQNGEDLCTRDPQLRSRGFWPPVKRPDDKDTGVSGIPYRLSATPGSIRRNAPETGEDNDYVLGELLGLSLEERRQLIADQVLWS